ncbi:unnamed protein product [Caenorhabditis angaria]|uniref:Pinin/SDK/MemA protein domain-containing protein n=1 Tax=Caenorhabditis angaria TaxID=860376 RepID=A0A9P1N926_9PELO|nr:unnamed protein product [Caenorhabditis angaria]
MDQMVIEDLTSDINDVKDKLREFDDKIGTLEGRVPKHQRISYDIEEPLNSNVDRSSFGLNDEGNSFNKDYRKDSNTGGAIRKRIISDRRRSSENANFAQKRGRISYDNDDEEVAKRPKKTVQSTIIMPALDSKGREEKIEKLKEENKDSNTRNRRMFSNLLMGTLNNFKKTERKTAQQLKQEEVEKKLEETRKQEEVKRNQEKSELVQKRREQERELQGLQRKKAIFQYAELTINQLKLRKGSIETTTSPTIYWQPVKHTVRSMELLQVTERKLDDLIREREEKMKNDLEAGGFNKSNNNEGSDSGSDSDSDSEGAKGEDEYDKQEDNSENEEEEEIKVVIKAENDEDEAENDGGAEDDEVRVELD